MNRKSMVLIVLALVAIAAFWVYMPMRPEPLRVSRETTYITGPLGANGIPDFAAALELRRGGPIPAEDNVVAGLAQVFRFEELSDPTRRDFLHRLGLSPDGPPTNPLVELPNPGHAGEDIDATVDLFFLGSDPWRREDWPRYSQWLDQNHTALRIAEDALLRGRIFWPKTRPRVGEPPLVRNIGSKDAGELAGLLNARAWSLVDSSPAAAAADAVAILRLAAVLRLRYGFFGMNDAVLIEERGAAIARYVLERGLDDEVSLSRLAATAGHQISMLDRLEEHRIDVLSMFSRFEPTDNFMLRQVNLRMDRYEDALRLPIDAQDDALERCHQEDYERWSDLTEQSEFRFLVETYARPPGRYRLAYLMDQLLTTLWWHLSPNVGHDPSPGTETAVISHAAHVLRTQARLGRSPNRMELYAGGWTAPILPISGEPTRFWPGYDGFVIEGTVPGKEEVLFQFTSAE